jgi:hypothetical protein
LHLLRRALPQCKSALHVVQKLCRFHASAIAIGITPGNGQENLLLECRQASKIQITCAGNGERMALNTGNAQVTMMATRATGARFFVDCTCRRTTDIVSSTVPYLWQLPTSRAPGLNSTSDRSALFAVVSHKLPLPGRESSKQCQSPTKAPPGRALPHRRCSMLLWGRGTCTGTGTGATAASKVASMQGDVHGAVLHERSASIGASLQRYQPRHGLHGVRRAAAAQQDLCNGHASQLPCLAHTPATQRRRLHIALGLQGALTSVLGHVASYQATWRGNNLRRGSCSHLCCGLQKYSSASGSDRRWERSLPTCCCAWVRQEGGGSMDGECGDAATHSDAVSGWQRPARAQSCQPLIVGPVGCDAASASIWSRPAQSGASPSDTGFNITRAAVGLQLSHASPVTRADASSGLERAAGLAGRAAGQQLDAEEAP